MSHVEASEQPTGEIEAHLMHAAMTGLSAVMQLGPLHLMGRLEIPEDTGEVTFILDRVGSVMEHDVSGTAVRLEYWHGDTSSRFESCVLGRDGSRVRLSRPGIVACSDRRLVPRFAVEGTGGFRFILGEADDDRPVTLVDLSNTGLSFRCPLDQPIAAGQVCMAWLGLPDEEVVPIRLEIRNCRQLGSDLLVGARILDLCRTDRKSITRLIIQIRDESEGDVGEQ
jgi:hypothetical protein